MIKKISLFIAAIALLASCSIKEDRSICNFTSPVTVHVNDFSISQGEFPDTRSTAIGDYNSLKAITLAFYKADGTESFKETQFKADESTYTTFGKFSTTLPMGTFTMVVLGYYQGSDPHPITLTSPTSAAFTLDAARETFAATQQFTIGSNEPVNLTATLDRIISRLTVKSTDGRTANVNAVRATFSGGSKAFNPISGLSTDDDGLVNVVYPTSSVGATSTMSNFIFLSTDEQTMDITIEPLDESENVLFTKLVHDIPLKRNRVTTLTGALYSDATSAGSFLLNTDWLDGIEVGF